jgi:uncharacterized protein (DUF362 family)/NAD-dependent dihydropyrimidine dehydrogenase PreA subunit
MEKVFIKRCSSYNDSQLMGIFEDIIKNTDSIKNLKSGSKVLLKTNLLIKKKPEAAATTHPLFLRALAQVLLKRGLKVIVGDSPGGLFNKSFLKSVYEACGLVDAFKNTDIELNYNTDTLTIKNSFGHKLKEFTITKYIHDVDYLINVPKLKTHVAMTYTGAIKNWYGTIAGERKFDYHIVVQDTLDFANMLIDIFLLNKPHLNILDAIVGMDHNGPAAGKPKDIKLILASEDGFALDWTALKIIGIDPKIVPVMKAAFERNLLSDRENDVEIVGESIKDVSIANFVIPEPAQSPQLPKVESGLFLILIESIKPKIAFSYKDCKQCKECCKICPAQAIEMHNNKPIVNQKKCIKCFCCHELCTANAVKINQSIVLKSLLTFGLYNKSFQKFLEKMFGKIAQSRQLNRKNIG